MQKVTLVLKDTTRDVMISEEDWQSFLAGKVRIYADEEEMYIK